MYDRVRYLKKKRMTTPARKHDNIFTSLNLWENDLLKRGWNTLANCEDSDNFMLAFQSPWQKDMFQQHGSMMLMLDATHNSVNNFFLSDGKKINLYTFMIRDPVVGKGLPVAWAFTASAAQ